MAKLLIILLLMFIERSSGYTNYTANATSSTGTMNLSYSNNSAYNIFITPSAPYVASNDHYLEIKWDLFDVNGDMPDCNGDYVEVFLTRNYHSIGKFCSSNFVSPGLFTMYSIDGYAKMELRANSSNPGNGIRFSYRLRSDSRDSLGSNTSTSCDSVPSTSKSGVLYSEGWPRGYANSSSSCTQKVEVGNSYHARVGFMEVFLNPRSSCGSGDYAQFQGATSIFDYAQKSTKLCNYIGYGTIKHYEYFFIVFNRSIGSQYPYRGFVAGYVLYNPSPCVYAECTYSQWGAWSQTCGDATRQRQQTKIVLKRKTEAGGCAGLATTCNKKQEQKNLGVCLTDKSTVKLASTASAMFLGIVIGAVVIFIIILGVIIYKCKQRSNNAGIVYPNQAPTAVPMTSNPTTTGNTTMPSAVICGPSTVAYQQHPGSYVNQAVVPR